MLRQVHCVVCMFHQGKFILSMLRDDGDADGNRQARRYETADF